MQGSTRGASAPEPADHAMGRTGYRATRRKVLAVSFRHVTLFRWKPETPPDHPAAVRATLEAFAATLDGCVSYVCGPDAGLMDGAYDFCVLAEFEDRTAWDRYMVDPEHDRIRADVIGPYAAARATIQLEG
jgi:hypothetical protein